MDKDSFLVGQPSRYDWSRLTHLQVGRYGEYLVKMEFTLFGFDVYTSEVDDKGIDFVIRKGEDSYYDVQVKSVRTLNYFYITKEKFSPRGGLLLALVVLSEGKEPKIYLIPSMEWLQPDGVLVDRTYEGKKSAPEWGINLSTRNLLCLERFDFSQTVWKL